MADGSSSIDFEGMLCLGNGRVNEGLEAVLAISTVTSLWHRRLRQYALPFTPGTPPSSSLSEDRRHTGSILENKGKAGRM
jgi:hypothetical protein